jgi:hypothetical protein
MFVYLQKGILNNLLTMISNKIIAKESFMELVYLWVEDYKNIQKQGFNFSPRFRCEYDEKTEKLSVVDKEKTGEFYPKNFFGDNINVTAIVGENGSGKSSIIELLYSGTSPLGSYFYIFDLGKELVIKGLEIKNQPSEVITNNMIKKEIFNNTKSIVLETGKIKGSLTLIQNKLSFIYFSTFLEWNEKINTKCIIGNIDVDKFDISSAYLINHYSKQEYEMDKSKYNFNSYQNQYQLFKNKNIQNVINMLKNSDIKLPINTPEKLYISIDHTLINRLKYIEKFEYKSQEYINNNTLFTLDGLSIIEKIKLSVLINFFDYSINNNFEYSEYLLAKVKIEIKTDINNVFEAFVKVFSIEHYKTDMQTNPFIDYFFKINELLQVMESWKSKIIHEQLSLSFDDIGNDFIDCYQKITLVGLSFFHFNWFPNLSSGQENLLFQFANFYSLKLDRFTNKKLKDNIYIFIDEGENTLHPNWQKKYISYLIEFFSKNFIQKINIIISSHSSFILSDIPKQNVIFLEKDEKTGNCINATDKVDLNPFGANIHTLLSHGFFMKDGLMGEFAKEKIQSVIKYHEDIDKKEIIEADKIEYKTNKQKEFWQIQSIIGDDYLKQVIKNHLIEIEKIVLGNDEAKKEEVKRLKAQIELLEK